MRGIDTTDKEKKTLEFCFEVNIYDSKINYKGESDEKIVLSPVER
jgi:hypothetical protein